MKYLKLITINAILFAMVYVGMNVDNRALDVFQFFMWSLVICGLLALFIDDEKLFSEKDGNGKFGIFLMVAKVILCIWSGMVILAGFYFATSLIHKARELAYLEKSNE